MLTRYLFILFVAGVLAIACGNNAGNNNTNDTTVASNLQDFDSLVQTNPAESLSGCYQMTKNRDTAFLKLETNGKKVKGSLLYSIYEKDSNKGELEGTIEDSLIRAYYTFKSEGMTSVREIVLKIKAGELVEGMAPVYVKNDSAWFVKDSSFKFADDRPYLKVACK